MPISDLIIRLLATVTVLVVLARINGPKQIAQMNFYDYIVGITVGSLAASATMDSSIHLFHGLLSIALYFLSGTVMSWVARKNMVLRRFLSGKPIMLVAGGEIQWNGLKRARMNINELLSNLRYSGHFNLSEVDYAVFEPTGKISVQPKGFARPLKPADFNVNTSDTPLQADVMIDGTILQDNLKEFHKDVPWLMDELKSQGINDEKQVGLATLDAEGVLTVYQKDHNQTTRSSFI